MPPLGGAAASALLRAPGNAPAKDRRTWPGLVSWNLPELPAATLYDVRGTMPRSHPWNDARRCAWNGSWNGALSNPSTTSAISAIVRVISAAKHVLCTGPYLW